MKNKILSVVVLVAILFSTMFVLTGCGENKEKINENSKNNTAEDIAKVKELIENDKGAKVVYEFMKKMCAGKLDECNKLMDEEYYQVFEEDEIKRLNYGGEVEITHINKVSNLTEFNKYWKDGFAELDYEKEVMPIINECNDKLETYIVDFDVDIPIQYFVYTINRNGEYRIAGLFNKVSKKDATQMAAENKTKNLFMEVLEGKRNYIDEENVERTIEDYKKLINNTEFKYAIFDLDRDKQDELVAQNSLSNLILNYEDGKIYGFYEEYRGMSELTVDGYCVASGGTALQEIRTFTFNKNVKKHVICAEADERSYVYRVYGRLSTENGYNQIYDELIGVKEKVKFIEFKSTTVNNSQNSTNTETNTESKASIDGKYEYTFPKDGKDVEGSKVTLDLANGKITYCMEYFDNTMKGTYKVNGNKIEATYTEQDIFNQGANKMDHEKISKKETYEISGNNIIVNNYGEKMTFKKK